MRNFSAAGSCFSRALLAPLPYLASDSSLQQATCTRWKQA